LLALLCAAASEWIEFILMPETPSPLQVLRQRYSNGETDPVAEYEAALWRADSNAGCNVYLSQDVDWSRAEAQRLRREDLPQKPLWGVPVALKDCFDLAGFPTSCGSIFYREENGIAKEDSTVATRLRKAGAIITGKTHLHQLAYGITGENRDFGDCLQPRDATLLTGGSSSGSAAAVQEGSALAAIGTDTGGSIRVPAALCGLAGYRGSIGLGSGLWQGGAHLAQSFDTLGWIYRDLRDGPVLAEALFGLAAVDAPNLAGLRIGLPDRSLLRDSELGVLQTLARSREFLEQRGCVFGDFDAEFWKEAVLIFAPIQASEAAAIHAGNFEHFEPAIAERLKGGAELSAEQVAAFRARLEEFRKQMVQLFDRFDYLMLPCSPLAALRAGVDHSETRGRLLRYTAPLSMAGLPVVAIPAGDGGLQIVGPLNGDAALLALSAELQDLSIAQA
jgi:aspartyl-tRNA(Asn)/glutamyl-tRNA(Gln) amidotransferase subunit A